MQNALLPCNELLVLGAPGLPRTNVVAVESYPVGRTTPTQWCYNPKALMLPTF